MNKKKNKVLIYFLITLLLIGFYPSYRVMSKFILEYKVSSALEEKGFSNNVSSSNIYRDSKTGRYVMEMKFKDEMSLLYTYKIINGDLATTVFDEENVSIEPDENLKYYLK